ncbi:ABC transporter permease [Subtercola endophyticus]|uniref:ABC transporter permease n=1 Tax=Subtercola endophyticus TaxID=2895559 RepID=UPI001E5A1648|nr:ABC transporter permease [Subtercola endophyticus]UFS59308.1 ABC transporter permease [Subtercola endophyticus]
MTTAVTTPEDRTRIERRIPPFGGFNFTFLALEIRRVLRNRRTLIFTIVMPVVFLVLFALPNKDQPLGNTGYSYAAYVMISFAVYGAMLAATSGGGMVAVERAQGWSRQLRLTPLRPAAYITIKMLSAMFLGLIAVVAVFIAGAIMGITMPWQVWLLSGLVAWIGSMVFATLGLFVGYLVPSENVMQILGPLLAFLALFGGLFVPLEVLPQVLQDIAKWTPAYGVGAIARTPLLGNGFDWWALVNVLAWGTIFGLLAARMFRRDTKRV